MSRSGESEDLCEADLVGRAVAQQVGVDELGTIAAVDTEDGNGNVAVVCSRAAETTSGPRAVRVGLGRWIRARVSVNPLRQCLPALAQAGRHAVRAQPASRSDATTTLRGHWMTQREALTVKHETA